MKNLDIFIQGENVDLCIPTADFARDSDWYSWFNNPNITKYLEQGLYPNTQLNQELFFQNQQNRLTLIISTKKNVYKGVVSLSAINLVKKTCDIAIVVDSSVEPRMSSYVALESIALLTEHGFNVLGMNRISAGQHVELGGWQQRMELLGYRVEGIHPGKFVKGHDIADVISISASYADFKFLLERRGSLWDGTKKMSGRINSLPKEKFSERLKIFLDSDGGEYYQNIFSL